MSSFNKVILVGNLTRDPEKVESKADFDIARGSIAVNQRKKGGEERVDYFDFTAFRMTATNLVAYKTKGDKILIDGHLQLDQWEKDGQKRSKVTVIADNITFLPSAKDGNGGGGGGQAANDAESEDIPF